MNKNTILVTLLLLVLITPVYATINVKKYIEGYNSLNNNNNLPYSEIQMGNAVRTRWDFTMAIDPTINNTDDWYNSIPVIKNTTYDVYYETVDLQWYENAIYIESCNIYCTTSTSPVFTNVKTIFGSQGYTFSDDLSKTWSCDYEAVKNSMNSVDNFKGYSECKVKLNPLYIKYKSDYYCPGFARGSEECIKWLNVGDFLKNPTIQNCGGTYHNNTMCYTTGKCPITEAVPGGNAPVTGISECIVRSPNEFTYNIDFYVDETGKVTNVSKDVVEDPNKYIPTSPDEFDDDSSSIPPINDTNPNVDYEIELPGFVDSINNIIIIIFNFILIIFYLFQFMCIIWIFSRFIPGIFKKLMETIKKSTAIPHYQHKKPTGMSQGSNDYNQQRGEYENQ